MSLTRPLLLVAALLAAACGDGTSPTSPTPASGLEGTWTGELVFSVRGQTPRTSPVSWTFTHAPFGGGVGYDSHVTLRDAWLPLTRSYLHATLVGSQFGANGTYASPRGGCDGSIALLGTGDSRRIDARVVGTECYDGFEGHVTLTR